MEERIVAPDPIAEPEAYRQALLDFIGDQDPLEIMASTPHIYRDRTDGLSDEILHTRPEPGEWSVEELLGHFWHGELVYAFRWRIIVAQDHPLLVGYDQDAWTSLPRPPYQEMLDAFAALRAANVMLIKDVDPNLWERSGRHEERGEESFGLGVHLIAGHDLAHLRQLEQTLAAVTT